MALQQTQVGLRIDKKYLLQKWPGKGGWTFAAIPEIAQDPKNPFGWVQVKGFVDNIDLGRAKLMPMGNGRLFLPIKAEIRKKIGKQAGDWVHIVLEPDYSEFQAPQELMSCLEHNPEELKLFTELSATQQKILSGWVYAAKKEETRERRILQLLNGLSGKLTVENIMRTNYEQEHDF